MSSSLPEIPENVTLTGRPKSGKGAEKFPKVRKFSHETSERMKQLEDGFVLDGVTLSRQTNEETGRSNPSVNIGIPQYNPLTDKHTKSYFKQKSLPKEIMKPSSEKERRSSMAGSLFDDYMQTTVAVQYLESRKKIGAGYTRQIFGGHTTVPTDPVKPGYHGEEGYRKNTPDLRRQQSVFDYEDPFDNPRPLVKRFPRTLSAPATMRIMRQKSASVYRSNPGGGSIVPVRVPGRRAYSAMPRASTVRLTNIVMKETRELATGPLS